MAKDRKRCSETVFPVVSRGIMGRGAESFAMGSARECSRLALPGDEVCRQHRSLRDRVSAELAKRRGS